MKERQALLDACALVEALRPAATTAIGNENEEKDGRLLAAWDLAREKQRAACAAWVESLKG